MCKSVINDLIRTGAGLTQVTAALVAVKESKGRARRDALCNLDKVVTTLFPPVEGSPLPSDELNGIADILPNVLRVGVSLVPNVVVDGRVVSRYNAENV